MIATIVVHDELRLPLLPTGLPHRFWPVPGPTRTLNKAPDGEAVLRRVLIGDFGAIVRLGLREILDEEGMTLVAEESVSEELMWRFLESRPDVVVVDLDEAGVRSAREIATTYPAVKVIACSSDKPTLRVYPPFHRGESYELLLSPESFALAVKDPA